MNEKIKILHCRVCDKYFPDTHNECPSCGKKEFNGIKFDYTTAVIMTVVISVIVGFFSPIVGFILAPILLIGLILSVKSQYKRAEDNSGYYTTDKTRKYVSKHKQPEIAEHIIVQKSIPQKTSNELKDFNDSLFIVWAGDSLDIEFSYQGRNGERSRRNINLEEVAISDMAELYFTGYDSERYDTRTFKVDRIKSKIKYNNKKYFIEEFFSEILLIDIDELIINWADNDRT